jgi:hypothetical protein
MRDAVEAVIGQPHFIPLFSTAYGTGNNTYFRIVGFVPVTITDVKLQGSKNSYIMIQPRVVSHKGFVVGSNQIDFDVTPQSNPNPLVMGARGLVR